MGEANIFSYLSSNKSGIMVLILSLFALLVLFNWFVWILGLGRFKSREKDDDKPIRYILVELFAKIIDDFRHLLALVVILIFAAILSLSMFHTEFQINKMADALQAVVSTLGGLVGSIIGYYFGESAAMKRNSEGATIITTGTGGTQEAVQSQDSSLEDDSIYPAPEVDRSK